MFFLFLIVESPNGKKLSFHSFLFFSFFPVVFIVSVLAVFFILPNHPLHYFNTPLEWVRISAWWLRMLFLRLLSLLSFFIIRLFLEVFNIGIPDVPLSNLSPNVFIVRRNCSSTALPNIGIHSLHLTPVVVEFVSHWLFNGYIQTFLPSTFLPDPGSYFSASARYLLNMVLRTP